MSSGSSVGKANPRCQNRMMLRLVRMALSDFLAKPIIWMNAAIERAGRENDQEIRSVGDTGQQCFIEIATVQFDDVQKHAQAALHQFFTKEQRGSVATLAAIADKEIEFFQCGSGLVYLGHCQEVFRSLLSEGFIYPNHSASFINRSHSQCSTSRLSSHSHSVSSFALVLANSGSFFEASCNCWYIEEKRTVLREYSLADVTSGPCTKDAENCGRSDQGDAPPFHPIGQTTSHFVQHHIREINSKVEKRSREAGEKEIGGRAW